jgi:hypothetical protein
MILTSQHPTAILLPPASKSARAGGVRVTMAARMAGAGRSVVEVLLESGAGLLSITDMANGRDARPTVSARWTWMVWSAVDAARARSGD